MDYEFIAFDEEYSSGVKTFANKHPNRRAKTAEHSAKRSGWFRRG